MLPRLIDLHRVKELAFFADVIDAKQAEDFGIVNKVLPHGELDAFVDDWADRLAAGPPIAVAMTKRLLTLNASADFATALEGEGMAQSLNFTIEDTKEAVNAFLEKRPRRSLAANGGPPCGGQSANISRAMASTRAVVGAGSRPRLRTSRSLSTARI